MLQLHFKYAEKKKKEWIYYGVYDDLYCYDLRGSCSWESMRDNLNDIRFANRRDFRNRQAPSAMVIYNDAVHTQRNSAGSTGNQTQRYYLT